MLEPSIDSLQEKIESKYTLVALAAKRARKLLETQNPAIENPTTDNYVGIALEEVQAEKLFVHEEDE